MSGVQIRTGILRACVEVRGDCSEWEVEVDGVVDRAVAFASLAGPLRPGDRVTLNTTAKTLALGTGGAHFVIARNGGPGAASEGVSPSPFPGREAGHVMKLRYTPLQLRVQSVEEEASPHRQALQDCAGLQGIPVLAAELHSQAGAAAIAARAASPDLRIVMIQLDSAALPLAYSRLMARLRSEGVLDATVTVGQAFGGDYEAVNVYSGLEAVRAAAGADLILVTQGPGNVGTGTRYGFSGLALVEALHAAELLGGAPVLAARMSDGDPRPRHQGFSHHTETLLSCLRVPVTVPVPQGVELEVDEAWRADHQRVTVVPEPVMNALKPYRDVLTTMGRALEADLLFFRAAAAAGVFAAGLAERVR